MVIFGYGNKFSGLTRSLIAILAGLVLIIWPGMATTLLIQGVAIFFIVRALMGMLFGGKAGKSITSYFLEILLAFLLFQSARFVAGFIIYIVAFVLILLGLYQIFILFASRDAFRGSKALMSLPVLVIICAFLLLFVGGKNWVSYLAGATLILYGVSDLLSLWTVEHYASKMFQSFESFARNHGRPGHHGHSGGRHGVHYDKPEDFYDTSDIDAPKSGINYDNVEEVDYEKVDEQ